MFIIRFISIIIIAYKNTTYSTSKKEKKTDVSFVSDFVSDAYYII